MTGDGRPLVILATWGPEAPARATLPWLTALAAAEAGQQVTVFVQGEAVWLATVEGAGDVCDLPFPPVAELVDLFLDAGGEIRASVPCLESRGIRDAALVDGATPSGLDWLARAGGQSVLLSY